MRRPASLALIALITLPGVARAADLPLADYRKLVQECRTAAQENPPAKADLTTLSNRLKTVQGVVLADKTRLPLDLKQEANALADVAKTGKTDTKLSERFAALGDALTERPTPDPKLGNPQAQAQAILATKEFAVEKEVAFNPKWPWLDKLGKALQNFLDGILKAIGRFLRWVFGRFPAFNGPKGKLPSLGDSMILILGFLATVVGVVAIYFLTRYGIAQYLRRTGRFTDEPGGNTGLDLTDEGIIDPLGTAKTRANQGDYRSAIRLVYIASLQRLESGGLLVLQQNKTNWEYQRALRSSSPRAYDTLLPATRLFDRIWYGRQQGTAQEFDEAVRVHDSLPVTPAQKDGGQA